MSKLEYTKINDFMYYIFTASKASVGRIIQMEDGLYYFNANGNMNGLWDSWILLDIGSKLKELNESSKPIDNLDPFNDLGD